jgi:hypothetical protein
MKGKGNVKKIFAGMIVIGLLAGCSTTPPKKINTVSQEDVEKEKNTEDNYIKITIESAKKIQENVVDLKDLLSNMNVNDLAWKNDVNYALMKIKSAANDYTGSEIVLSKKQLKKYEKTISNFDESVSQFHSITNDASKALETIDMKVLGEISNLLDSANELLKKSLEQLETERYKAKL